MKSSAQAAADAALIPTLAEIEEAAVIIRETVPPTPQYRWPLLCARLGTEVWVKHENHTVAGAFKLRGGLTYFHHLARKQKPAGVVSATRGNHGQSVGYAAKRYGIAAAIVVPFGNSSEKNAAMCALGVELIEHGDDFQAAREYATALAQQRGWHMVPSFHRDLVTGVATYCLEFLRAVPDLDTVYVPIGMGSGICAMIAARDALGLRTRVVGVVSSLAPAYALSFAQKKQIEHAVTTQIADGMAVRLPAPDALDIIWSGVERMVEVDDAEVEAAMRVLFEDTHNVAEGAGAAALAAAIKDRARSRGRKIGVVLSGGNVDREVFARVLAGAPRQYVAAQAAPGAH
jgi:threonine dehydratase